MTYPKRLTTLAAASLLLFSLGAAQPGPPARPPEAAPPAGTGPAPTPLPFDTTFRDAERAGRAIEKASRKGYELEYLLEGLGRSAARPPEADELWSLAQELLSEAQADFGRQTFFAAHEKAKAAEDLYKALEKLHGAAGELSGAERGGRRGPPPHARGGRDAGNPYRAFEEIHRLEQELAYYAPTDARAATLTALAKRLLEGQALPEAAPGFLVAAPFARADAAEEVASAARHLIAAARGF